MPGRRLRSILHDQVIARAAGGLGPGSEFLLALRSARVCFPLALGSGLLSFGATRGAVARGADGRTRSPKVARISSSEHRSATTRQAIGAVSRLLHETSRGKAAARERFGVG